MQSAGMPLTAITGVQVAGTHPEMGGTGPLCPWTTGRMGPCHSGTDAKGNLHFLENNGKGVAHPFPGEAHHPLPMRLEIIPQTGGRAGAAGPLPPGEESGHPMVEMVPRGTGTTTAGVGVDHLHPSHPPMWMTCIYPLVIMGPLFLEMRGTCRPLGRGPPLAGTGDNGRHPGTGNAGPTHPSPLRITSGGLAPLQSLLGTVSPGQNTRDPNMSGNEMGETVSVTTQSIPFLPFPFY